VLKKKECPVTSTIQILLVDDEVRFLNTLADRLRIRKFKVVTATDGFDALKKARDFQLDLALIDLKMPGMDGEELLQQLKKEHPLVEVVILTGHGSESSRETCQTAGSFSYLQKPCETQELVAVLREAFEKRMMRRLDIDRKHLDHLIQTAVGESSFQAILRLKEMENMLLERRAAGGTETDDDEGSTSSRID
jgi:DNA-binding response OmpR family regulator